MNPLGSPTLLPGTWTPRLGCDSIGAGARLGSPPEIPGVDDCVRGRPTEDAAEESAVESGFVGFLRYAGDEEKTLICRVPN